MAESTISQGQPILEQEYIAEKVDFNFSGQAGEFFGIWIVNVLLSILTLGIYSAWAKVRTNRYFYGNTAIDGHRFSYLATPLQILKGRLIAVALFGLHYLLWSSFPIVGLVFALVFFALTPWLICSSLRFNLRMSSYRHVRFNFTGKYLDALINFMLLPILSLFTLYLLLPWVLRRTRAFVLSHTHYGDKPFQPDLSVRYYYKIAILTVCLSLLWLSILVISAIVIFGLDLILQSFLWPVLPVLFFVAYLGFTVVGSYYQASIRNHIFTNTKLTEVAEFSSSYGCLSLAWLQLTNSLALIVTFGLAYPWAKIRQVRYAVEHTQVLALPGKDQVIDNLSETSSSIGDEVANAFDVDVTLT